MDGGSFCNSLNIIRIVNIYDWIFYLINNIFNGKTLKKRKKINMNRGYRVVSRHLIYVSPLY